VLGAYPDVGALIVHSDGRLTRLQPARPG
jgi:hypothetical protein